MILISFLGKGNYQEVTYFLQDSIIKEFKSKFFVHALSEFYKPTKTIIFMTNEAEKKYENELKSIINFEKKKIMEGKNEKELWDIFETLEKSIPTYDDIIIDVTHGFRSIPIVALAVIIFLNILNKINVKKIVYGAFEARDFYEGKAPVFDITNFLDLIEWSYATDEFLNFGNAKRLRSILDNIHEGTYRQQSQIKSKALKSLGKKLDEITTALSVIRPSEVSKIANELPKLIQDVKNDIEALSVVKPLGKLLDKIPPIFQKISEAEGSLFDSNGFKAQARMINFYVRIEKYQQAITLARESIVSFVCCLEQLQPLDKNNREQVENKLNEWSVTLKKGILLDEKSARFAELWYKIIDYRNDINHAGMKKNPCPATKLIENIKDVCYKVECILNE